MFCWQADLSKGDNVRLEWLIVGTTVGTGAEDEDWDEKADSSDFDGICELQLVVDNEKWDVYYALSVQMVAEEVWSSSVIDCSELVVKQPSFTIMLSGPRLQMSSKNICILKATCDNLSKYKFMDYCYIFRFISSVDP